jgi:predicted acyltransferase
MMQWRICVSLFFLALPALVEAQDASCTYASCALRIEGGFFRTRILAGEQGAAVARIGGFGTDLEKRVTLPDSALVHLRRANSSMRTAGVLSIIGGAGILYASFATGAPDSNRAVAAVAGLGFTFTSSFFTRSGGNELSRALWWYNAQFAH